MTDPVARELAELRRNQETILAFLLILLGRVTDHTHFTIAEVCAITGLSQWQVRKHFPLEVRPGVRKGQVPATKVLDGWMSWSTAQAIAAREVPEVQAKRARARRGNV